MRLEIDTESKLEPGQSDLDVYFLDRQLTVDSGTESTSQTTRDTLGHTIPTHSATKLERMFGYNQTALADSRSSKVERLLGYDYNKITASKSAKVERILGCDLNAMPEVVTTSSDEASSSGNSSISRSSSKKPQPKQRQRRLSRKEKSSSSASLASSVSASSTSSSSSSLQSHTAPSLSISQKVRELARTQSVAQLVHGTKAHAFGLHSPSHKNIHVEVQGGIQQSIVVENSKQTLEEFLGQFCSENGIEFRIKINSSRFKARGLLRTRF